MVVDVSGIGYFAPILAFLVVFVILFAILYRTKLLGENPWVQLFVSFLISSVFVSAAGVREYVLVITPWFAALVVSLFFLLFLIGFVGKPAEFMNKGIGAGVVIVMIIVFLVSGFIIFSDFLVPYLPGSDGAGGDPSLLRATEWLYGSRVVGALLLVIIGAIVSTVLVRSAAKK